MQPHYSQSCRENAIQSGGKAWLASPHEVLTPRPTGMRTVRNDIGGVLSSTASAQWRT